ncbi:MAG: TonB family protein [Bacillota bacterium]|nr:TonB family protein [Bacillota bacterium]
MGRRGAEAAAAPLAEAGRPQRQSEVARSVLALALSCLLHLFLFLLPPPGQLSGWGKQGRSPGQEALSLFLLPSGSASPFEAATPEVRGAAGPGTAAEASPVAAERQSAEARPVMPSAAADLPPAVEEAPPAVEEASPAGEGPHPAGEAPRVGDGSSPVAAAPVSAAPVAAAGEGAAGGGPEAVSAGASGPGPAGPAPGGSPDGSGARPWHPVPRTAPLPDYPPQARREGQEGTARLRVEVLPSGSVGRIELLASSGHPALDRAALEALRRWSFTPAPQPTPGQQKKGAGGTDQPAALPAPVWLVIAVRFALLNP